MHRNKQPADEPGFAARRIAAKVRLTVGDPVGPDPAIDAGRQPERGVLGYALDDLLAQITSENQHDAIDWGPPRGREII